MGTEWAEGAAGNELASSTADGAPDAVSSQSSQLKALDVARPHTGA